MSSKRTKKPPGKPPKEDNDHPKKRGRKGRDWDALFAEWLASGLPKSDFLQAKGINPTSGSVCRNTSKWSEHITEAQAKVNQTAYNAVRSAKKQVKAVVANVVPIVKAEVAEEVGQELDGVKEEAQPSAWALVNRLRQKQAHLDWKTSDDIRLHLRLILKNSLTKKVSFGEDGTEKTEYVTTLRPSDVKALSQAAADLQRIQRLALGLSTDNIGLDARADPNVEKPVDSDEVVPVFVVEMSRRGKFVRSRPRRDK